MMITARLLVVYVVARWLTKYLRFREQAGFKPEHTDSLSSPRQLILW
jgi:hypothetical protein